MENLKLRVLKIIAKNSFEWQRDGIISISSIMSRLNIDMLSPTRYRVNKVLQTLIDEGHAERAIAPGGIDEYSYEPYPPLKGYQVTEKYKLTTTYKQMERADLETYRRLAEG